MVPRGMEFVAENVYDAVFPALDCGTIVSFYVSAETTDGEVITGGLVAPAWYPERETSGSLPAGSKDSPAASRAPLPVQQRGSK